MRKGLVDAVVGGLKFAWFWLLIKLRFPIWLKAAWRIAAGAAEARRNWRTELQACSLCLQPIRAEDQAWVDASGRRMAHDRCIRRAKAQGQALDEACPICDRPKAKGAACSFCGFDGETIATS